jgi:paraquat-inducible protein B
VSQKASPTLIGFFLLGAIALIVIALAVFGGGRFFTETSTYVAYFPESIGGLSDGAPVNFRGVKVGIVRRIEVQLDAQDLSVKIPVYLELQRRRIIEVGATDGDGDFVPELIQRGLRAQLQLQSIVTGQLSVQLDIDPARAPVELETAGDHLVMPTIPSSMHEFTETMEELSIHDLVNDARHVLAGLKALLDSRELEGILTGINELVSSGDLRRVGAHTNEALDDLQALIAHLDDRVGSLSSEAELTLAEVNETLAAAQQTLASVRQSLSLAAEGSPMRYELDRMLTELTAAARSIRLLAEYLERNPDALLRGRSGGS